MNKQNQEDLINLNIKKRSFNLIHIERFNRSIERMTDLHPTHSDRLQFLAGMSNNFKLFWVFYTIARHMYDHQHQHYSQRMIKELIVHHTKAATTTDDGYRINNDDVKYLAELVVIYDSRVGSLFYFRRKDQEEMKPVDNYNQNLFDKEL